MHEIPNYSYLHTKKSNSASLFLIKTKYILKYGVKLDDFTADFGDATVKGKS